MYAKRDKSANYGSLLQIQRLMSGRKMFGRAEDLSVLPLKADEVGESNECCPLTSNFDAKNSRSEAERAFELPYFGRRPAEIKLIVQGGNTDN